MPITSHPSRSPPHSHCYTKRYRRQHGFFFFSIDAIAERRILQAIARGELDGLPGAGKPLPLDDDALVPDETRVAYRILKNAGFVPAEILGRREIARLEALLPGLDASGRARTLARLAVLRTHLFEKRTRVGSPSRIRERR